MLEAARGKKRNSDDGDADKDSKKPRAKSKAKAKAKAKAAVSQPAKGPAEGDGADAPGVDAAEAPSETPVEPGDDGQVKPKKGTDLEVLKNDWKIKDCNNFEILAGMPNVEFRTVATMGFRLDIKQIISQEKQLRDAGVPIPEGYEPTKKSYSIYPKNGSGSGVQVLS